VIRALAASLLVVVVIAVGGCREQNVPGAARGTAPETLPSDAGATATEAPAEAATADASAAEAIAAAEVGSDGAALPLSEGLVGWWRFDEMSADQRVADSSGRGNDGMTVDVPEAAWIAGRQGRALDLQGGRAHVRVPSSVSINGLYRAFSVTAFVLHETNRPERETVLARQAGYALGLTAGRPFVAITVAGRDLPVELAAVTAVVPGRWVHVAATFDGAVARVFLEGKAVASLALEATIGNSNVPVTIGARLQGTMLADPLGAALDEVRLYARALTAAEIAALSNPD
jgi:hypothetical protein